MQIKILTIGDSAVGKTALLNQFANKQFSNAAIPTIGIGKFIPSYLEPRKLLFRTITLLNSSSYFHS